VNTRGRFLSGLVTTVIALAGFVTAGALPAAATPDTVDYVALGDSYAAGTALRKGDGTCLQSDIGYPTMLNDESIRINLTANVACSGATTNGVRAQLSALNSDTLTAARLVTLTVGGANLDVSGVAKACLAGDQVECSRKIGAAKLQLGDCPGGESPLGADLTKLFGEVADKAPRARIVVTGYPLLFEPPADDDPDHVAKTAINKATTDLNCVIERAVATANAADVNIHYVDVTEEFAGHGIVDPRSCTDSSAFIHSLLICDPPGTDLEAFHPTAKGYNAYADAIKTKLPGGWFDKSLT
jgi:lysophospholipase L1-like esterase